MTKEEKIKEAYREWWQIVKNHVDENGWFNKENFKKTGITYNDISATVDFIHDYSNNEMIPKEIHGIRNNNGWIKIESESDLPKDSTQYWIMQSDGLIQTLKEYEQNLKYYKIISTHYQPIIKPNEPIY